WGLVVALSLQVALGALVVLSGKQPLINTLHVATGATVLVTSLMLTLRAFRVRFELPSLLESRAGQQRSHACNLTRSPSPRRGLRAPAWQLPGPPNARPPGSATC